ncbi:MAG: alpha/beta fold hydrolase, partial [Eggerthellaceae bacterium]|nr:alpha/beta fold hydrolase [Eggerthellaceae bacterium]
GVVLLGLALIPAFLFTGYQGLPTTGQHEVAQASAILVDHSRTDPFETDGSAREIPAHFYYPADAAASPTAQDASRETYPLVVFSHGAFGFYRSNYSTYMELASHGYVVVALDYPHHAFITTDTNGQTVRADSTFLQTAVAAENNDLSDEEEFAITHEWLDLRCADLNFVLDTLESAGTSGVLDKGTWWFPSTEDEEAVRHAMRVADTNRIGLAGHSLGGATSVELGRTRDDVDAVIDIDGTMFGSELAFEDGSAVFDTTPYPVPLLSMDNENHYLVGQQLGNDYVNNVVLDNAEDATHTYFVGSGHLNFTDLPLFSPALASLLGTGPVDSEACVQQMNALVLQFFDYYLKGEGEVDSIATQYDPGA